ncbi:hypothetical protein LXL04_031527 [Taraxacum kok-saghyz]
MINVHLILSQTRLIFSGLTDFSSVLTEFNSIWSDFWSDSDPNPTRSMTRVYKKLNPKISHSSQNRPRLGPVSHPGDFRRTLESFSVVFRRAISVVLLLYSSDASFFLQKYASFFLRRELLHPTQTVFLRREVLPLIRRAESYNRESAADCEERWVPWHVPWAFSNYSCVASKLGVVSCVVQVYFTVYDWLKGSLSSDDGSHQLSFGGNMIAASGAGVATIMFSEVVRARLQEQGHHSEKRYTGMVDCIKKVLKGEGVRGFYRGCATNLLRTTPAAFITFTSFEMIHHLLLNSFPPN